MTTAFDTSIARHLEKGNKQMVRRIRMEKRMASGLVRACLKRGYAVTIDNGEDKPIEKSKDYRAIMKELWATDEEHVLIYDDKGKYLGWFFLVYGNDGYDLIADYSANEVCDELYNTDIEPLANRVEAGG